MRGLCQGRPAICRAFISLVEDRAGWRAAIECLLQRTRSEDWKACNEW